MTSTATVDLAAVAHNVTALRAVAGTAALCAVVKADGYGHGAVPVARAALDAGATWLAVAQVPEACELVAAGVLAPTLLLSEPDPEDVDRALALGLHLVVYRPETIDLLGARAEALGVTGVPLHLKVDTGMRRVGCRPDDAVEVARRIAATDRLAHAGTMTHLARADEPDDPATTDRQLDAFDGVVAALRAAGLDPGVVHAANSGATILHPRSRLDLVRTGIAVYGIPPAPALAGRVDLRPALRWTSRVGHVAPAAAGDGVSYGHRHVLAHDTVLATVACGYADGVRRRYGLAGGTVLVGGVRCPVLGVVTMDQFVIDVGAVPGVAVGDEVVLVGSQGEQTLTAADVAAVLDTIAYEVVCDIGARVRRSVR